MWLWLSSFSDDPFPEPDLPISRPRFRSRTRRVIAPFAISRVHARFGLRAVNPRPMCGASHVRHPTAWLDP
jgi:hypothetical protein